MTLSKVRLSDYTISRAHLVGLAAEYLANLISVSPDGKVLEFAFDVDGAKNAKLFRAALDSTFPRRPTKAKGESDASPFDSNI